MVALLTLGTAVVQQARAGCLQFDGIKKTVSDWRAPESLMGSARFIKAGYLKVSDAEEDTYLLHAQIVGLWSFQYISKGNLGTLGIKDGVVIDHGNTLWFADGNELTVSGMRDPATGSTCLGIWKHIGKYTYELNHIGLSWDPTTSPPSSAGPAFVKQYVTLDPSGNHYSGIFSINQLKPDGKTAALPAPIKGYIEATRVTVDTDTQPQ